MTGAVIVLAVVVDQLVEVQQGCSVLSSRRDLAIISGVAAGGAVGSMLPGGDLDLIKIYAGENGHG